MRNKNILLNSSGLVRSAICFTFILCGLWFRASAAQIALVYENEEAAKAGKFIIASMVQEGVLLPASLAMKSNGNLLIGPIGDSVYQSSLVRLDNELNLAVMKLTAPLGNGDIQTMHQLKSRAILSFLPQVSDPASSLLDVQSSSPVSHPIFELRINKNLIDSNVLTLKSDSLRKSKFNLEVVVWSSAPVWSVSLEVTSDPKLSFWKQGRHTGLNDIPRPVFSHDHQALFKPLQNGQVLSVPIEAHYIDKDKTYTWTIHVKSKLGEITQTANIKFD